MKYLQGGNALPPLVSYQPVTVTGGAATASPTKESSKTDNSDLTDKDLLEMLGKLDGLPSDMAVLTLTLQNFYIDLSYGTMPSTSNIASRYLLTLNLMKVANANKKEYDSAFDIVSKNGGINELAINDRGQLYCVNQEGNFQLLSLQELKQNSEYLALTNSDLLYYRYESPKLANNNDLIKVVKNGIGIETVTKMILDNISNLGSSSESNEGYIKTLANLLINGLLDFMSAQQLSGDYNATVDNLYKAKMLTKNLAIQAELALNYIYLTLPINAKTLLKTKTTGGTDEEAKKLIYTLINSKMSTTNDFSLSLDETPESVSNKSAASGKSEVDADLVSSIQAGINGHDTIYQLDNKSGIGMTVEGTAYEQVKDTKGTHIGRTSVENLLNDSGLRSIINADNGIFFGNLKVDQDVLLNITYDGKGLLRANLPIKSDGSPNFDILNEYSKAQSEFLLSQQTPEDRLRIFGDTEKYPGISTLIKPTGELDMTKFAPFIVASGMTTDAMVEMDDNNEFVTEVEQTPNLVEQLKTSLSVGSGKDRKTPDVDDYGWWEIISMGANGYDHLIRGNIYIPINMNKGAAALGGNLKISATTGLNLEKEYLNRSKDPFLNLDPSLLK